MRAPTRFITPVVDRHGPDGDRAIREELVVLPDRGEDRLAEGQRHPGEPEDRDARDQVFRAKTGDG